LSVSDIACHCAVHDGGLAASVDFANAGPTNKAVETVTNSAIVCVRMSETPQSFAITTGAWITRYYFTMF
jgi:hypothetical protein